MRGGYHLPGIRHESMVCGAGILDCVVDKKLERLEKRELRNDIFGKSKVYG